jgi:choline dehydrogenase
MHHSALRSLTAATALLPFVSAFDPRVYLRDSIGARVDTTKTWDYVIIGSGPAGFVLYEQLSQNSSKSVALLEAGPNGAADPLIYTPGFAPFNTEPIGNQYDWNYTAPAQQTTVQIDQGHVLGGGSSINYNTYCRGAASVFDEWANVSGNNDLKWKNLFADFQDTTHYAERPNSVVQQTIDESAYGNGPLELTHFAMLNGFDPSWFNTLAFLLSVPTVA